MTISWDTNVGEGDKEFSEFYTKQRSEVLQNN
jgi:hypothetical protein